MIKVLVKPEHISLKGHADFAERGKDIVCASVSSIVTTTVNAILSFNPNALKYEADEGLVDIDIVEKDDIARKLIDNMLDLLSELELDYPKNIKVERE